MWEKCQKTVGGGFVWLTLYSTDFLTVLVVTDCVTVSVIKSQTIRDFDERFTAQLFGFDSYESYYHDASVDRKVHDVQIPLLCLSAADDPFSPLEGDYMLIPVTATEAHNRALWWRGLVVMHWSRSTLLLYVGPG